MRGLVFCLLLSLCLHGGWLWLSMTSASTAIAPSERVAIANMPGLRISEPKQTSAVIPTTPAKPQVAISHKPAQKMPLAALSQTLSKSMPELEVKQLETSGDGDAATVEQVSNSTSTHAELPTVPTVVTSHAPRFRVPPSPPQYPPFARRQQQTGEVVLAVYLDANGRQERRQIMKSSGYQLLDQAAERAVSAWQFLPEIQAGSAVPSRVEIPIRFSLSNQS